MLQGKMKTMVLLFAMLWISLYHKIIIYIQTPTYIIPESLEWI